MSRRASRAASWLSISALLASSGCAHRPPAAASPPVSRDRPYARAVDAGARSVWRPSWGLDRLDQRTRGLDGWFRAAATGAGVTIYIVDSGIRTTHREFSGGRAELGADFVGDGRGAGDCDGHGTYVAGLAGGATYGVASGARLVSLRVADCHGHVALSALLAALSYVADAGRVRRPAVVDLSLVVDPTLTPPGWIRQADRLVRRAVAAGVTFVVSAGNSAVDACDEWPARIPEVIAVSATDEGDARMAVESGSAGYGPCVDLFAPGVRLRSAWSSRDDARRELTGSSGATAYVAGAAALLLELDPTASPATVARTLTSRATAGRVSAAGRGSPNRLLFVASRR